MKVLLAAPRGYCAGVERAVEAVEAALAKHGAPVYVRKQIVHNLHVVREDICYATQNRQDAVKELARRSDVVLVIGSDNSSNSNRLAEVAKEQGTPAYLVDDEEEVDPAWLEGAEVVGLTSGASAPEWLVERMLTFLAGRGVTEVEEVRQAREHLRFSDVRV